MDKWTEALHFEKRWCICHHFNIFVCFVCKSKQHAIRKLHKRLKKDPDYYIAVREVLI